MAALFLWAPVLLQAGSWATYGFYTLFIRFLPIDAEVALPRTKSAEKQLRQSHSHAAVNRAQRSQLRTAIKRVRAAAGKEAETAYAEAVQLLDRAGRKNLIHRNTASRTKSRLAKLVGGKKAKA
jgi:small subunit ribosomal protein S20